MPARPPTVGARTTVAGVGAFLVEGLFQTPFERHSPFELKGVDLRYRRSFAGPARRRWFGAAALMGGVVSYGGDGNGDGGHLQIGREALFERSSVDLSFRVKPAGGWGFESPYRLVEQPSPARSCGAAAWVCRAVPPLHRR